MGTPAAQAAAWHRVRALLVQLFEESKAGSRDSFLTALQAYAAPTPPATSPAAAEEAGSVAGRFSVLEAVVGTRDALGRTPVHVAAAYCNVPVLEYVVREAARDEGERAQVLRCTDSEGRTPLHYLLQGAVSDAHRLVPAASLLLQSSVTLVFQPDADNLTPLQLALDPAVDDALRHTLFHALPSIPAELFSNTSSQGSIVQWAILHRRFRELELLLSGSGCAQDLASELQGARASGIAPAPVLAAALGAPAGLRAMKVLYEACVRLCVPDPADALLTPRDGPGGCNALHNAAEANDWELLDWACATLGASGSPALSAAANAFGASGPGGAEMTPYQMASDARARAALERVTAPEHKGPVDAPFGPSAAPAPAHVADPTFRLPAHRPPGTQGEGLGGDGTGGDATQRDGSGADGTSHTDISPVGSEELRKAEEIKASANQAFQAGKHREAALLYANACAILDRALAQAAPGWAEADAAPGRSKAAGAARAALRRQRATLYSNLSAALAVLGQFQAARNAAEIAVASDPDWFKPHFRLAKAHEGLNDLEEATQALYQAALRKPGDSDLRQELARTLAAAQQQYKEKQAAGNVAEAADEGAAA